MLIGLGVATAALAGSQAQATATTTNTMATADTCTKYVVISPQPVEIWIDAEPTPYNETWYKLSLGQVFCAYGTNASNTRFQVDYYCHPPQCDSPERVTGWVTNSQLRVIQLNCTARTLNRSATVYTVPEWEEAWMEWPSGTTFCTYGSNATATRHQVFVYCGIPFCARPEGVYVGWVTSDPSYYVPTTPAAPSNMSASTLSTTSIRLRWTDNSINEDGFEIINGVTSRQTGPNATAYTWDVAPGTYMCFKIRAFNASGYSSYHPSAQMDWVCITT